MINVSFLVHKAMFTLNVSYKPIEVVSFIPPDPGQLSENEWGILGYFLVLYYPTYNLYY